MENVISIPYSEIPGFVVSTAPGHAGSWITGTIQGKTVCIMAGRLHCYEGYSMQEITFPIRVMKQLGVETLFLTNASGSINRNFFPGDFMLLRNHIRFGGSDPLIGFNDEDEGPRFPKMTYPYDEQLAELTRKAALKHGIALREGVYVYNTGPTFETASEVRMFEMLGGDALGMSTIPEVIVARYLNIRVLAISCITNFGPGLNENPITDDEVDIIGKEVAPRFKMMINEIIKNI